MFLPWEGLHKILKDDFPGVEKINLKIRNNEY